MVWNTGGNTSSSIGQITLMDTIHQKLAAQIDPTIAEYIDTACNIYEMLLSHYPAIADDLAYRQGLKIQFPQKTDF